MNMTRKKKTKEGIIAPTPCATSSNKPILDEVELKNFSEFVKKINLKNKKTEQSDIEALNNMLREYTNCYLLLGYNTQKEAIVVSYSNNILDANGLKELLRQVFFDMIEGGNSTGQGED